MQNRVVQSALLEVLLHPPLGATERSIGRVVCVEGDIYELLYTSFPRGIDERLRALAVGGLTRIAWLRGSDRCHAGDHVINPSACRSQGGRLLQIGNDDFRAGFPESGDGLRPGCRARHCPHFLTLRQELANDLRPQNTGGTSDENHISPPRDLSTLQ